MPLDDETIRKLWGPLPQHPTELAPTTGPASPDQLVPPPEPTAPPTPAARQAAPEPQLPERLPRPGEEKTEPPSGPQPAGPQTKPEELPASLPRTVKTPPPGAPKGEPPKPGSTPVPSLSSLGIDALPRVAWAVDGVESGHNHFDDKGNVKTSEKGAQGRMGLMPNSFPGVNVADEQTNLATGRDHLRKLYGQYKNWTDALVAYNWGEHRANEWIKAGRPDSMLPDETKRYLEKVSAGVGADPGLAFTFRRNKTGEQDTREIFKEIDRLRGQTPVSEGVAQAEPEEAGPFGTPITDPLGNPLQYSKETSDRTAAFMSSAYQGLRNLAAGPIQFGLEKTAPDTAREFTEWINRQDEPFSQAQKDYPWSSFTGNTIGTTVGLLAATRLLGPVGPALGMGRFMGPATNAVVQAIAKRTAGYVGGAALGGLTFNENPDSASRTSEAVIGAMLGRIGLQVGKAVGAAVSKAADSRVWQNFTQAMKDTLQGVDEASLTMKNAFADYYERVSREKNVKYAVRNRAGDLIEGYPAKLVEGGGIAELIDQVKSKLIEDQSGRQVAAPTDVKRLAAQLDETLGLKTQRQEFEDWLKAQEQHEKELKAYRDNPVVKQLEGMAPAQRASAEAALRRGGQLPEAPQAPAPFEERPITAQQYADARKEVQMAQTRARQPNSRYHLGQLKARLEETARQTADEAGMDVSSFERKMRAADKFNRQVFSPLQTQAGGLTAAQYRASPIFTNAKVYDQFIGLVRGNARGVHDREALEHLYNALGPVGRERAKLAVQKDMFDYALQGRGPNASFDPGRLSKYVYDHRTSLETVLGRDQTDKLLGTAKIGERIAKDMAAGEPGLIRRMLHTAHPWVLGIAALRVGAGAVEGHIPWHEVGIGGMVLVAPYLERALQKMSVMPRLGVIIDRAAKVAPDSREMEQLLRSVDMVMTRAGQVAGRQAATAGGGQPVSMFYQQAQQALA